MMIFIVKHYQLMYSNGKQYHFNTTKIVCSVFFNEVLNFALQLDKDIFKT